MSAAAGKLGGAISTYGEGSPEAEAARREYQLAAAEETIRCLVRQAPPLPESTRRELAAILLNPAGVNA